MPEKAKEGMRKGLAILKKDRIKSMRELAEYFTEAAPPKTAPQPEPKTQPQPEPKPEPKPQSQPNPQPEFRAAPKAQSVPQEEFKTKLTMEEKFLKGITLFFRGIGIILIGIMLVGVLWYIYIGIQQDVEKKKTAKAYQQEAEETSQSAADAQAKYELANKCMDMSKDTMITKLALQYYEDAVKLYEQAANSGSVDAMNALGAVYEESANGTGFILRQSLEWYKLAAEHGYDGAQESVERVEQAIKEADANN